jgi:hypothetical protein
LWIRLLIIWTSRAALAWWLESAGKMSLDEPNRKRWARHGGTRWLSKPQHVSAAMQYVITGQGEPMSVFESHEL